MEATPEVLALAKELSRDKKLWTREAIDDLAMCLTGTPEYLARPEAKFTIKDKRRKWIKLAKRVIKIYGGPPLTSPPQ